MNSLDINEGNALLEEFLVVKAKKGKLFDALTISSLFYIAFVLIDFAVDVERLALKSFDWQLATALLALPFFGMIFHLTSKTIGWIINFLYYLSISLLLFYTFLQNILDETQASLRGTYWRACLFLLLSLSSTIFLFSNPIRKYFRIRTLLVIIMTIISVGLTTTMVLCCIWTIKTAAKSDLAQWRYQVMTWSIEILLNFCNLAVSKQIFLIHQ